MAGRSAAAYLKGEKQEAGSEIRLIPTGGVRYTVPSTIHTGRMEEELTVRFRVGQVFRNSFISVYLDEERISHRKRMIMAPGEMEQVVLKRSQLLERPALKTITIKIEEA